MRACLLGVVVLIGSCVYAWGLQMLALNPADIVSKLSTLFTIVLVLFGGMHIIGALLLTVNVRQRKDMLNSLKKRQLGFKAEKDGSWTWDFRAAQIQSALESPSPGEGCTTTPPASSSAAATQFRRSQSSGVDGTQESPPATHQGDSPHARQLTSETDGNILAAFAKVLGCPAIRLRLAIPENLLPGSVCACPLTLLP